MERAKWIMGVLALVTALGLAGCGQQSGQSEQGMGGSSPSGGTTGGSAGDTGGGTTGGSASGGAAGGSPSGTPPSGSQ